MSASAPSIYTPLRPDQVSPAYYKATDKDVVAAVNDLLPLISFFDNDKNRIEVTIRRSDLERRLSERRKYISPSFDFHALIAKVFGEFWKVSHYYENAVIMQSDGVTPKEN